MEGFELIATGLWSIVPPILALVLALITKEVYSSLTKAQGRLFPASLRLRYHLRNSLGQGTRRFRFTQP